MRLWRIPGMPARCSAFLTPILTLRFEWEWGENPRQIAKIGYTLFDVLFLTVCAVIAGAKEWEDIKDFGEVHIGWLQKKGLFPSGLPVHNTISRIVLHLNLVQFQQCFIHWVQSVNKLTRGELVAVDGKVLRGSYDRRIRCSAIHMVSAFEGIDGRSIR